ncbi:hypothetical protein GUITHDRAFT_143370 [Guillardia theta CCMP2712]|uniref:RSE1/DDB1/CPSF1 second beta-propeller domain-containing protein n=1 Tax=Guillardia theta (strain CCMP2712) TaxID=905079 RepID=L1ITJ3_GUITC|nr:hypothetical protein GUITHDRAFT_143370 [Guillardia theta CCMP2712]EKX39586.1 hypothetical protein GUITHDRAFT_143370 [Guillardia theta CCMP2712]|eukprot:XP_005826566.1 hypothetical protein GUITHDRAFT_143370 [Guillardia theta CCMP2712]
MLSVKNCRQPSSVVAATVGRFVDRHEECLFSATLAKVMLWQLNPQGEHDEPLRLFGSWPMFSGITGCATLHGDDEEVDSILLLTRCFSWSIVRWDDSTKSFEKVLVHLNGSLEKVIAQGRLQNPSQGVYFPLPDGALMCQRAGPKRGEELVMVCCWNTIFHLFNLQRSRGGMHLWIRTSGGSTEYNLVKGVPGPNTRLISWCFLLPPNDTDFEDCPLMALLFEDEKGIVDLETCSIKYEESNKLNFNLLQGPWSFSTLHPETSLGRNLEVGAFLYPHLPSSQWAIRITSRFAVASSLAVPAGPGSNRKKRSMHWILGSNDGQMHILSVSGESKSANVTINVKRIDTNIPLSNPRVATILRSQERTLQLWCTKTGYTSILDITKLSHHIENNSQTDQEIPGVEVMCSPFEESLGSIKDAIAVDFLGDGEMQLLLACGEGSDSCLRLCRSGLEVSKIIEEGPEMPECSDIFALRGLHILHVQPHDNGSNIQRLRAFDSHLVFSFASINQTKVLELDGHEFVPVTLPGLCEDANTVFITSLPHGHLVQVTEMEIRLINMRKSVMNSSQEDYLHVWTPKIGNINMASVVKYDTSIKTDGNQSLTPHQLASLVVAVDSVLSLFEILTHSNKKSEVKLKHSRQFEHQISAVWPNEVHMLKNDSMEVKLPDKLSYQQYNQHCVCDQVAVVGSSTGIAHIFPIPSKTSGIVDVMTLIEVCSLRVGETAVSIHVEETEQAVHGIFLHSNYNAWIHLRSGELEVKRINGIEKVKAVCSLHTELMPTSLVWINEKDCLQFGKLAEDRQTSTIYQRSVKLAENVVSMTHSSRHRCLLLLTESPVDASNRMRIFSDDSLQEIWSMQLMPGHMWSLIASSKLQTDIPSALDPEAAAIDSEIFLTVSYVETNDPKSSASSYLQDKEEDKQREDDSQEFQRGEKAVIAAWEIESVISKPREDQDPDVTFDIRLIGIKEVKKVFTYLHSTDQFGVFFASAASELFLVKCSSLDERDAASFDKEMQATGRRFGRIGELHMKLKVDILPGEPDHKIPYVGKGLVHDGSYKDGSACALRWLGDMDLIEIHSNNLPPSPGSELFEVVASLHPDREGLHEIVSCKLFDKSRGVVGDALGNLLIFERLGDRIAALFCMNARSGGITRIMEGRMGLHFLNKVDEVC